MAVLREGAPARFYGLTRTTITDDERVLVSHVMRWGSAGWPVAKLGRSWVLAGHAAVDGHPGVWKTKREAVAAFERLMDLLLDVLAYEAWCRAQDESLVLHDGAGRAAR